MLASNDPLKAKILQYRINVFIEPRAAIDDQAVYYHTEGFAVLGSNITIGLFLEKINFAPVCPPN